MNGQESGLLVVDKPAGLTSHQVVAQVRRLLGTRKVGHAGTLDPMATGVLILGVNRATRLLGHLALQDKGYLATIRLGQSTTTDDAEGEPTGGASAGEVAIDQVSKAITRYTGDIQQVPSSVSAIKVDGQRAYARVRAGEVVQLAARSVHVSRYELLSHQRGADHLDLDVVVDCSTGTYVRALARDLGADLGVGGHLTKLRRTRIGQYSLDNAMAMDECTVGSLMSMAAAAALSFPVLHVSEEQAWAISHGQTLKLEVPADPTAMVSPDGQLLALYRPEGSHARPVTVLVG